MEHLKRLGIGILIVATVSLLLGWGYAMDQGFWWSYIPLGLITLYYIGYILTKE